MYACRQIIQVDSIQHGSSSCQFEPDALVSAIKHIVEAHVAAQEGSHAQSNGIAVGDGLQSNVRDAPPLGFHDL